MRLVKAKRYVLSLGVPSSTEVKTADSDPLRQEPLDQPRPSQPVATVPMAVKNAGVVFNALWDVDRALNLVASVVID